MVLNALHKDKTLNKENKEGQAMQFLDVKTDYVFEKVFGSDKSKNILISFLNAVIDPEGDNKIVDLTIVDPYQIPLIKGMKDNFVYVKAMLSNNKRAIIEIQVFNFIGPEKKILYNAARSYSRQLQKSEHFKSFDPIIALTITDFYMFEDIDRVITYYKLLEKETLITYNNDIELIFVELPKFKKFEHELETITDKWIFFIKNAGSLEYIPESLAVEKEIKEAFDSANTAGMTEEELEEQWKRHEFIYFMNNSIEFAAKKAREEGIKEAREEEKKKGKTEAIREVARKMLKMGIDKKIIIEVTGLTEEEVEK